MNKLKPYLGIFFVVVGLAFVFFMAIAVVPKIFVSLTKAAPATKVSINDSYLIGGDILAKADGVDKSIVNVYVLDKSSKGVKGIQVSLSGMGEEMEGLSGVDGKTVFELTSTTEGVFELTASVGGVPLAKTLKVTFRN
ncbi:MAG TPA: Ig-like domain-containing protein [Candidatus Woesebacteria bacterium]|nr:Ig-like domain-containing protein [Candidatus Woesebacteria bacterium]